ncbi:hypothetical protein C8R44DRAFT_749606 [Mycena epipterygia]|nr:hypothetical protein C8R44DRAFT_749606 [Mycena epipterygia]
MPRKSASESASTRTASPLPGRVLTRSAARQATNDKAASTPKPKRRATKKKEVWCSRVASFNTDYFTKPAQIADADASVPNVPETGTKAQKKPIKNKLDQAKTPEPSVNEPRRSSTPPRVDLREALVEIRKRVAASRAQDDDAVTTTMPDAPPRRSFNSDLFDDYDGLGYDDTDLNSEMDALNPWSQSSGPRATASPPSRAHSSAAPRHRAGQRKKVLPPPPSPHPRTPSPAARPRRPRQPQPVLPPPPSPTSSELSSSDEYGKQHALAEKERARIAKYDRRAPRSIESEDEEETRNFEREVDRGGHGEEDVQPPKQSRRKSVRPVQGKEKHVAVDGADEGDAAETAATGRKSGKGKAKGKGKGKAKPVEEEEEEEDDDEDDEGESMYSRGRVPQAIRDRLFALKEDFHSQVAELAAECNKSPTVLHRILGTTSPLPRAVIAWNVHQVRYSVEVPFKDSGLTPEEYNKASRAAFLASCGDVDPSDSEAVFRKIPELRQWHKKMMETAILQLADDGKLKSKVQTALKPLLDQARHMHTNFGVHIWGFCIDPQGEASFAFGATEEFKIVREQEKLSLNSTIKDWETKFRYLMLNERDPAAAYPAILPGPTVQNDSENNRDRFRRAFGSIMHGQVSRLFVLNNQPAPSKMPWNINFLNAAFTHKFRLINYPNTLAGIELVGTIGGKFDIKKFTVKMFKDFMPALERANTAYLPGAATASEGEVDEDGEKIMAIVPWHAHELLQPLDEQYYLPLVIGVDGQSLFKAHHSDVYNTIKEASLKRSNKRVRSPTRAGSGSGTRSLSPEIRAPDTDRPSKRGRFSPPPPPPQPVRSGPSHASTSRPSKRGRLSPPPPQPARSGPRPGPSDASTSRAHHRPPAPPAIPFTSRPSGPSRQGTPPPPPPPSTPDMSIARFGFRDSEEFRVKDWVEVSNLTRAERAVRVYNAAERRWVAPPANLAPNPHREDRELYWAQVRLYGLGDF